MILLYLGFLNCEDLSNGGYQIFKSNKEWKDVFEKHAEEVNVCKDIDVIPL